MNKLMITRLSIRPNNTGRFLHLQSKQKKRNAQYYTTNMMQTLTHKLKSKTMHMLCKSHKHKMDNLIKYTTQEHPGYVAMALTITSIPSQIAITGSHLSLKQCATVFAGPTLTSK